MRRNQTQMLVKIALMTAMSLVLMLLIRIPFPLAPFLVYDPADIPIYICTFAFGPGAGLAITFIVSFLQAFALGGDGIYGFVMHFVATGIVAVMIGFMYKRNKTKKTALKALGLGVIVTTLIMCVMNIFVTSAFMGVEKSVVIAMLPTAIIPFNLIKFSINAAVTFVVYKRISGFLHNETVFRKKN